MYLRLQKIWSKLKNDDGVLAISDEDRNSRLQTFCKIGFLKNFANYRKRLAAESKMTKQLGKVIMKSFWIKSLH